MTLREPVYLQPGAAQGTIGELPVVDVVLSWNGQKRNCTAMLDTGATMLHVDSNLLAALQCPATGQTQRLQSVHSVTEHAFHAISLIFPQSSTGAVVEVVSMDLTGRTYQAIFGTYLLSLCVFHLDLQGQSYLEFHPTSIAPTSGASVQ